MPGPIPKGEQGDRKLDPHILAAAKKANPNATVAVQAALTARSLADEAEAAAAAAESAAQLVQRRTVIVNAAPKPRSPVRAMDERRRRQYCDLLAKAVTPPQAAKAVGVTTALVKSTMKADPEFAEQVRTARADATAPIVEAMWDLALSGSFHAQKYLLENMAPEDWRDPSKRIDVAVSGQIESVDGDAKASRIERIRALEGRLAERLALRAAGDQIEDDIADAELVDDAPQIEDPPFELGAPQIED